MDTNTSHRKKWLSSSFLIITCLGFLLLLSPGPQAYAQLRTDSVRVFYRVGQSQFDPAFQGNGEAVKAFIDRIRSSRENQNTQVMVEHVFLNSSASPEGNPARNEALARSRQQSAIDYLDANLWSYHPVVDLSAEPIDWNRLRRLVEEDPWMPLGEKRTALEKLNSDNPLSINDLQGTDAWTYLMDNIFPKMRTTLVVFIWEPWPELMVPDLALSSTSAMETLYPSSSWMDGLMTYPEFEPLEIPAIRVSPVKKRPSTRDLVLKLNLATLPVLVFNGGIELQPLPHLSFNIPVYYCPLDWFSNRIKFRVLAFQPEVRYWFRKDLHGLFLGAHGTLGWYNVAWNGPYRYQDHAQRSPSLGGGLNIGYKVTLGRNNDSHWGLEFGVGGGVIPLHYDYYHNVENGRLAGEDRTTYWGVDQAFISLTYRLGQLKLKQK